MLVKLANIFAFPNVNDMVGKIALFISALLLTIPNKPKTILFFGDSLTAGYGLSTEEAFPAILEKDFKTKKIDCRVINGGLSGETSAGGLSRIDWMLRQPVDVFVLELGANDGLRGLPPEQTEKNLQAIVDKVKNKNPNVKIVLAGMLVPPNMGKDYADKFKTIYPRLAKKNNAVLIPFLLEGVAGVEKLNQADGIHPTAEGHKLVAEHIKKYILPLVN